ncbi:predicted protein [Lichtheimia corymbifera JMRC:FSU:9682]|uniref:Uncharacterized protein n=1 Tax=Lichtheimia corymbifera JMRC:FSU:9682 TaxID=1263082 RepID=A0A068SBM8_9FUNG|nr:predicted protein [Lichtheimia corymbifera JMRC:FSU:9682]
MCLKAVSTIRSCEEQDISVSIQQRGCLDHCLDQLAVDHFAKVNAKMDSKLFTNTTTAGIIAIYSRLFPTT